MLRYTLIVTVLVALWMIVASSRQESAQTDSISHGRSSQIYESSPAYFR